MSGSQHNPNGRQSQLGSGWSPLQLQMANLLARAPQAHMASDRGVTWHTPTPPPPHLYHVPAPSPPDPLQALSQAMKTAGSNSVFRHTATPPELYRHTPTPPDKHLIRHTPSPGDVKGGAPLPPVDLYPHLGPTREKLVRAEELVAYARVGVDLSLGSRANGAPPALSVRDAPTINSLIARAAPRRVDALLERLAPSPHSVIVHPRTHTPSPPSSNEDSGDSCGGAGGMKRKRKPERTHRLPAPAPAHAPHAPHAHDAAATALTTHPVPPSPPPPAARLSPPPSENGDIPHDERNGPPSRPEPEPAPAPAPAPAPPPRQEAPAPPGPQPPPADTAVTADTDNVTVRRKTRSGSAETIADIAAMIASETPSAPPPLPPPSLSVDKLKSVLASPEPAAADDITQPSVESAAAPRRRAARDAMLPVESPCEGKPAEPPLPPATQEPEPSACFVEVENQLEKMFAGIEEPQQQTVNESAPTNKRRKSGASRGRDAPPRRKGPRKKPDAKPRRKDNAKDKDNCVAVREGYDSGSNASSGRSRGPYIQIRGPRESPVSVCVMNAGVEEEIESRRRGSEKRRGLHASTLGLRYDASTRDATWLCAFCGRGPHAAGLGDLFGPYPLDGPDAWLHADCGVWAPGVLAAGSRVWGLARAVKTAAAARCQHCAHAAAPVACSARGCAARAHLPCARDHAWTLREDDFRALCPHHSP